jgi:uncharacterized membrane protein YdcZ (DUF606 family)
MVNFLHFICGNIAMIWLLCLITEAGYGLLFLRKEYWYNFINGAVCGNMIELQPIRCKFSLFSVLQVCLYE